MKRNDKILSSCPVLGIVASTFFPIAPMLKICPSCTEKETQAQRIVQGPQPQSGRARLSIQIVRL